MVPVYLGESGAPVREEVKDRGEKRCGEEKAESGEDPGTLHVTASGTHEKDVDTEEGDQR